MTILPYFFFRGRGNLLKQKPIRVGIYIYIVRYSPMSINKYTTNIRREMHRERERETAPRQIKMRISISRRLFSPHLFYPKKDLPILIYTVKPDLQFQQLLDWVIFCFYFQTNNLSLLISFGM